MSAVSIVLGFSGGDHTLHSCLRSALDTTPETTDIIVVANFPGASTWSEGDWPSRVSILRFDEMIGNARAMNVGIAEATTPFIVLADYDLLFLPGWLEALHEALGATEADAAAPMLLNPTHDSVSEFGIAYTKFNGAHPYKDQAPDHPVVNRRHFPQATCSGGMLLRRETFIRVGGFNEELATMYGDVDFCFRMKRAGLRIVAEPSARLYHLGGWDSHRPRPYKSPLLKGDHKGAFVWDNRDVLMTDLESYFARSIDHLNGLTSRTRYVACRAMNVANPDWYIRQLTDHGTSLYETHHRPSGRRDADQENLLELFGYEIMTLRLPILYFVDRFISMQGNALWWKHRAGADDLVVDRNANIVPIRDIPCAGQA
jgi:GT2 family glycosyltransferase